MFFRVLLMTKYTHIANLTLSPDVAALNLTSSLNRNPRPRRAKTWTKKLENFAPIRDGLAAAEARLIKGIQVKRRGLCG